VDADQAPHQPVQRGDVGRLDDARALGRQRAGSRARQRHPPCRAGGQAWSALTSAEGPQLSHEEALEELRAQSGAGLDPSLVETMAEVIELERCLTAEPACQLRVHRLPLPGQWRQAIALRFGGPDGSRV